MEEPAFEALALEEWEGMPEHFKKQVENVALLVEDTPSNEVRRQEHLDGHHTLLGLYHGIPNTVRGGHYGVGVTLPDTITLYRLPILHHALHSKGEGETENDALRRVVRETIWHEVGHYFGLGDESLHVREDEGTNRFES